MTQTVSLSETLLEHTNAILQLKSCGLSLDWLKAYSIPQLTACCGRMNTALPGISTVDKTLQRELIQNPAFAAYYAKLLPLFPQNPPAEKKPEPAYHSRGRYYSKPPAPPPSPRAILMTALCGLLESCSTNKRDVTVFSPEQLMAALAMDQLTDYTRLVYLENFAAMELSDEARQTVIAGLRRCVEVPLVLTEAQKALLLEPVVADRGLFASASFGEVWTLLDSCSELLEIARLLHDRQVRESLTLEEYTRFAQNAEEYRRLLDTLVTKLGSDAAGLFMGHWQRNGCPLHELKIMEHRAGEYPDMDWTEQLMTAAGYVNQLYGAKFKSIDLASVSSYQESILIYAIANNKKHFIRLVDEQADLFLRLPGTSALFQEQLYREHFNLNELSKTDLACFTRMTQHQLNANILAAGRRYTFPELRELCGLPDRYVKLYHLLQSNSQDYRLRILRQARRRGILPPDTEEGEIAALAERLDSKPLDIWMQEDFRHIDDLTPETAALLLAHLDTLLPFIPDIRTETDTLLVLRCRDVAGQSASVAELKENLLHTDASWLALCDRMGLSKSFQEQYRESIIKFLCGNGAHIAWTYLSPLSGSQEKAFCKVVKAELMGQLSELKYYEGDLQRELDSPLTARVKNNWPENLSVAKDGMEVRECDDFFSTMLLGIQPQRTCLSYINGVYRECLLSAFDSNKKVLYATLGGRVVGRAFLRLTKGRLTGADVHGEEDAGFTFVDLENPTSHSKPTDGKECLTLFLERPYISGVNLSISQSVMRLFVELAVCKADELNTMLVLSTDYRGEAGPGFIWAKYAVYISNSKAGTQYLDSLGGQATVSAEGSYKENTFLVREQGDFAASGNY